MKPPLWITLLLLTAGCSAASPIRQSEASFYAAYGADPHNPLSLGTILVSSSPPYVQITVVDKRTSEARTRCVSAYRLPGALQLEHDLPDVWDALHLALNNKERRFEFTKPEALANLAISYNDADLEVMRQRLAPYSDEELAEGFGGWGKLHNLYRDGAASHNRAYRDAAACVLIDRGFSPRIADRTGAVVISR